MSIQQEKFTEIADAIREKTGTVDPIKPSEFASKIDDVYESGKQSEYDAFWDAFQNYGNLAAYRTAFACFTDETYNPKYPIRGGLEGCYSFNTRMTTTKNVLIQPTVGSSLFRYATKIKSVPNIDVTNATTLTDAFFGAGELANICFSGEIRLSVSFVSCTKLSAESIQNIIDHLATVGTTQKITFATNVVNKLTDEQILAITSKNWQIG